MRTLFAASLMLSVAGLAAPAFAFTSKPAPAPTAPQMQVAGTLTCQIAPGLGLGVASSRPGTCIFDHIGAQGFSESYDSTFQRVGFDVGLMGSQSFKLTVMTPNGAAVPGMLAGVHQGHSSETSFVKADGLKVAFRSERQDIAFEQSAESSWVGLNVGMGDTSLHLDHPRDL